MLFSYEHPPPFAASRKREPYIIQCRLDFILADDFPLRSPFWMHLPQRKTVRLSRHRVSIPGARYFVACCTKDRRPGLTSGDSPLRLLECLSSFESNGDASLVCATLMPDHFHWIFTLGTRLTLSQVLGKWKCISGEALAAVGREWQENFYDHRLRPEDHLESYAFYVFMNPNVAHLIEPDHVWPWWRKGAGLSFDFEALLRRGGAPQQEWLGYPSAHGIGLGTTR